MSFQTQPADSSNLYVIPVNFAEDITNSSPLTFINKQAIEGLNEQGCKPIIQKQCRICLEGESEGNIISPCKCTGSVKYAHVKCLIEWIKRKVQSNIKIKARCELCDAEFNYRMTQRRIFDCSQLTRNYEKDKSSLRCFAIVYSIFVILFIGIVVTLIAAANGAANGTLKQAIIPSSTTLVIYVTVCVLYFIILMVVAVLFISEYVVRQQLAIADVRCYKDPPAFLKNFKIYFRR